jgi:hypothetical protein
MPMSEDDSFLMVAPIGADVNLFLGLRTPADDRPQILARHRSTRHRLRVATAVVDRDPSILFTLSTITVTD